MLRRSSVVKHRRWPPLIPFVRAMKGFAFRDKRCWSRRRQISGSWWRRQSFLICEIILSNFCIDFFPSSSTFPFSTDFHRKLSRFRFQNCFYGVPWEVNLLEGCEGGRRSIERDIEGGCSKWGRLKVRRRWKKLWQWLEGERDWRWWRRWKGKPAGEEKVEEKPTPLSEPRRYEFFSWVQSLLFWVPLIAFY